MAQEKKLSLVEKFQQLERVEKVSLFSYIGSWGGVHTLSTRTRGGETRTLQAETMKRIGMTESDIVNEGVKWARENVGDVAIEYSNSKQLPIVEKNLNTVPESINEAVKQAKYETNYRKALMG